MARPNWTEERLQQLFEKYRQTYWPASRRLVRFSARPSVLDGAFGRCEYETRTLLIDLDAHSSDRELRATVLHEMIHVVVGKGGHNSPFWAQLEYLLSKGAPVTVGFPELGEQGDFMSIIPPRFRRCRRLFRPIYQRHERKLNRMAADLGGAHTYTIKDLEQECHDAAALEGAPWRLIWAHFSRRFGFVDLDGRVLPFARKWKEAAHRGFRRGRRWFLEEKRRRERCDALRAASRSDK